MQLTYSVADEMTKRAVTVSSADRVFDAFSLMRRMGVRHLPVIDGKQLVGVISDRDIYRSGILISDGLHLSPLRVAQIMSSDPRTCAPGDTLEDAARTLADHHIDALPVVDAHGAVLGIISSTDLLRHLFQPSKRGSIEEVLEHQLQRFDFAAYAPDNG